MSNKNFSPTNKDRVATGANAELIGRRDSQAKERGRDSSKEEIVCYGQEVDEGINKVSQNCSKVVLVDIYAPHCSKPVRCYSILDEQSSRSFVSPELVNLLNLEGEYANYTLRTMTGLKSFEKGKIIQGLRICGANEIKSYPLPPLYSVHQ